MVLTLRNFLGKTFENAPQLGSNSCFPFLRSPNRRLISLLISDKFLFFEELKLFCPYQGGGQRSSCRNMLSYEQVIILFGSSMGAHLPLSLSLCCLSSRISSHRSLTSFTKCTRDGYPDHSQSPSSNIQGISFILIVANWRIRVHFYSRRKLTIDKRK